MLVLALVYPPLPATHRLLLVVGECEECYPDATPWPDNVPGQWLNNNNNNNLICKAPECQKTSVALEAPRVGGSFSACSCFLVNSENTN